MTATTKDYGFTSYTDIDKTNNKYGYTPYPEFVDDTPEALPTPEEDDQEGWGKWLVRTLYQIPSGIGQAVTYPMDLISLLASGEARDPEEIEHIRMISEREGIPFDEEKYMQAVENAERTFPTQSNIERGIEEYTGFPTQAKTPLQKAIKLGSTAGKFAPASTSQRATAAITAPAVSTTLEQTGLPEPISELAGLVVSQPAAAATKAIDIGAKTKPSGLPARRFEKTTKPTEVSESKISQINQKLESDFKEISNKIIKDSPIGETAHNLANDPTFKQQSRELLNQAQEIADNIPETLPTKFVKKEYADIAAKSRKGFHLDEYDKSYLKFMKEAIDDIPAENMTRGELVESYRKNNGGLTEYFEPGASKALNRAKRDALLDQNRAIAKVIEKSDPELAEVFKEGNARWTKIRDTEAVDDFVNELFKENINYKKMHEFFDKNGYDFIFKRALGEKGYNDFQQLMKDMLSSEAPYKMLKVAREKGWGNLVKTASSYMLHPKLGYAKIAYDAAKSGYKALMNALIDKPQIGITFKEAVQDLKSGKFAQAEKKFETLQGEVQKASEPKAIEAKESEPIEVKSKNASETFTTEKGSTYEVNEDGTTTRTKAYRSEHGEAEQGTQKPSEKTWFVSKEDADKLGEFQTSGSDKRIIELPDGRLGLMYESGKDAGKIEARTVVSPIAKPEEGLIPIESWEGGKKIHFGNKIVNVENKSAKKAPYEKVKKNEKVSKSLTKEEENHLFGKDKNNEMKVNKIKEIDKIEKYYEKIIQNERKKREIENKKDYGVSASLVAEGRHIPANMRKGNIKKDSSISKLNQNTMELFKKIEDIAKNYPEELIDLLHEEFFQGPFSDKYYKPNKKKILADKFISNL